MNSLTNNFAFYIMQIVCSEGILLDGSKVPDKAQIEKSVLYPAFYFLEVEANCGEESVMGLLCVLADALCEFWCWKRETDCADFEICIRDGGVWRGLDGTYCFCPQFLRSYFYDANGLYSDADETDSFFYCFCCQGRCGQRDVDLHSSGCGRGRCGLVCDAGYGIAGCSLRIQRSAIGLRMEWKSRWKN